MALNSLLQGAHQVAQKLIIIGLPLLLNSLKFTELPSMSLRTTLGSFSCAKLKEERRIKRIKRFTVFML
jgi:hypothetical protein